MTPLKTYDAALLRLDTQAEGDLRLSPRARVPGGRALSAVEPVEDRRTV